MDVAVNSRRSIKGSEGNWIEMQRDTFTNWVNANLKQRDMSVDDLETGFEDGVKLVNLFEVVSKRNVGRYAKTPKFANQKLENVSIVLKAMENDGVKIVSIDSDHIVNCNSKMILGLIWQLILRYQIGGSEDKSVKIALKKLLLIWLQHVIPDQQIKNLTTDWNSGVALCNLINVLQPGLCPEYQHMDRDDALTNATKGMLLAEEKLGIPQIISADNMVNPNVDDLSMMTYLSYFTQDGGVGELWTLNLVNSWNADISATNFNTDWNDGNAVGQLVNTFSPGVVPPLISNENEDNCRTVMSIAENTLDVEQIISPAEMANPSIPELAIMAYVVQFSRVKPVSKPSESFSISGQGVSDPQVGSVNEFYVRCDDHEITMDDLRVEVIGPDMVPVDVQYEVNNSHLRTYKYTAVEPGIYRTNITYQGSHVPHSPMTSTVRQDLATIKVHGDGIAGGQIYRTTKFIVDVGTTSSQVEADVEAPNGELVSSTVTNNGDGTYTVSYTPLSIGLHRIDLRINGQQLPGGAIETQINDPDSVTVSSQQYEEDKQLYAELHERIGIAVDTSSSGEGSLTAKTVGPRDNEVECDVEKENNNNYTVSFTPDTIGEYHTNVYWSGNPIQGCPFIVWVSDPEKVEARGDDLYQSRVYEESRFEVTSYGAGPGKMTGFVDYNGQHSDLDIAVKEENVYECNFRPTDVGDHFVHLLYNNAPINGSPYTIRVGNPQKVTISTEEAYNTVVVVDESQSLDIILDESAGLGDLTCTITGPDGQVPSSIKYISESRRQIMFVPESPGGYDVCVYYAGAEINGSPYTVYVSEAEPEPEVVVVEEAVQHSAYIPVDASKVYVTGAAVVETNVDELSEINVDAQNAGPGHLTATLKGGFNGDVVVGIRDNSDGTYAVSYTPPAAGAYVLNLKWDDEHVAGSPFKVTVHSKAEPETVVVEGDGIKEGTAGQPVLFTLDGRKAGPGQLSCRCRAPSGKMTYVLISDNKDGTYTVDLNATEPGLHSVEVEWDNQAIPGSPFLVRIMQAPDVKKVRAFGPGLKSGMLNNFRGQFQVDSKGAGPGTLKIRIHGPKGAFKVEMTRQDTKQRIIDVSYNPTESGIYTANVFWSDEHVSGSPFEIFVADSDARLTSWLTNREEIEREEGLTNGF